jgi:hypothetical protein
VAPRRTIVALVWGNETPSSSSRPRGKRGVQSCTYLDGFTTLLELAEVRRLESRDDDRFHDAIHALVAAAAASSGVDIGHGALDALRSARLDCYASASSAWTRRARARWTPRIGPTCKVPRGV